MTISVEPIGEAFAARVTGIDLSQPPAAEDIDALALPGCHCPDAQHALKLRVEDELADQPPPVFGVPGQVGVLTGEQVLVVDVVAVVILSNFSFNTNSSIRIAVANDF